MQIKPATVAPPPQPAPPTPGPSVIVEHKNHQDFKKIYEIEHPFCPELLPFKHILNIPVVLYFPHAKCLLLNQGANRKSIIGKSVNDKAAQWIISAVDDKRPLVYVKSLDTLQNFSIWCQGGLKAGVGWGYTQLDGLTQLDEFKIEHL